MTNEDNEMKAVSKKGILSVLVLLKLVNSIDLNDMI